MKISSILLLIVIALSACSKKSDPPLNSVESQLVGTWHKVKEESHYGNWSGTGIDTTIFFTSYTAASHIEFKKSSTGAADNEKELDYNVGPWGDGGNTGTQPAGAWYYDEVAGHLVFVGYWLDIMTLTSADLTLRRSDSLDTVVTYYHR